MLGKCIHKHGGRRDPSDLIHRRMLVKMVTHVKKVKSDSLLGRHRCWTDADVVEGLAVRGHPDGVGEVLREPTLP